MNWSNRAFTPVVGKCYEIDYATRGGILVRIRVDGVGDKTWINLDTGRPLEPQFLGLAVVRHREISCPANP